MFRLMGLAQFGAIPGGRKKGDLSEEAGWALAHIMTACGVTSKGKEDIIGCLGCLLEFKTLDEVLRIAIWFRCHVTFLAHDEQNTMCLRAG